MLGRFDFSRKEYLSKVIVMTLFLHRYRDTCHDTCDVTRDSVTIVTGRHECLLTALISPLLHLYETIQIQTRRRPDFVSHAYILMDQGRVSEVLLFILINRKSRLEMYLEMPLS